MPRQDAKVPIRRPPGWGDPTKPITEHPQVGQLDVVVSFRVADDHVHLADLEIDIMAALRGTGYSVAGIKIHLRER